MSVRWRTEGALESNGHDESPRHHLVFNLALEPVFIRVPANGQEHQKNVYWQAGTWLAPRWLLRMILFSGSRSMTKLDRPLPFAGYSHVPRFILLLMAGRRFVQCP